MLFRSLLADRAVEIVVDRGINRTVGQDAWERICRAMEQAFAEGKYEDGVIAGIRATAAHLLDAYPANGPRSNELPDAPLLI